MIMRKATLPWLVIILALGMVNIPNVASAQNNGRYDRRYNTMDGRDLEGRWYLNGHRDMPAEIFSSRRGLEATNEFGHTTRLEIVRSGNIRALDWEGGLHGVIRRDRIEWENGTIWMRQPSFRYARPR
jgi:hypothetical protein